MNSVQEFELLEEPKAQRHQDEAQRASDRDNAEMSRLGKKQVLKVGVTIQKETLLGAKFTVLSATLDLCPW